MKVIKERGITLVALVVTTIILLILAGVTISQIAGNDGLFSRVKTAVGLYKNASLEEEEMLLEFEKYVTDFTITKEDEGVQLQIVKVEALAGKDNIKVTVTIEGTATKIEYGLSKSKEVETWYTKEGNETSTEYTFEEVKPGSYTVKVRATDEGGKSQEAESGIVTVMATTTAEARDVKEGMTYIQGGEEYELKTGTMAKHEGIEKTIEPGEEYTIPEGYHDGTGTVVAKALSEKTPGDATSGDILEGKKAWVNGKEVVGNIETQTTINRTIDAGGSVTIPAGYYASAGRVAAKTLAEQTVGNAKTVDILEDRVAWVNGERLTGTIIDNGTLNKTLKAGESVTLSGYYSGGTIKAEENITGQIVTTSDLKNRLAGDSSIIGKRVFGLSENKIMKKYDWCILYADDENIYLISTDYIKVEDCPTTEKGNAVTKGTDYKENFSKVISDYEGSVNITEDKIKKLNKDFFITKNYISTNSNMKSVAYMLDTKIWTKQFVGNNDKVEYVIGGPSIELVLNAYNAKYGTNYGAKAYAINSTYGYRVSKDANKGETESDWQNSISGMLKNADGTYDPTFVINNSKESPMRLTSPSAYSGNDIMRVTTSGGIGFSSYGSSDSGIRPLIALKNSTKLEELIDGNFVVRE